MGSQIHLTDRMLEWILECILVVCDLLFGRLECHLISVFFKKLLFLKCILVASNLSVVGSVDI